MWSVKIDLSEVRDITRRAGNEIDDLEGVMGDVVRGSAEQLQATDTYQDRTGDLRASTQGEALQVSDNRVEATMAMAMPYASYVIGRGFSSWEDEIEDAEREMDRALSAIATRITRS